MHRYVQKSQERVYAAATENTSHGFLQVNVVNMLNNFPIRDATVTISSTANPNNTLEQVYTNSSGQTENVELAAPPLDYSLNPGSARPYSE